MTITFNELGNMGHLGNQMFQYASLRGIAYKNNYNWAIPSKEYFGSRYPLRSSIYDCFELESHTDKNIILSPATGIIYENQYHFNDDLYRNCSDGVDLNGYFQSEKYFEEIKNSIKKDFTFKESIRERAKLLLANIDTEKAVVVHVRRTDYVGNMHHYNIPISYYLTVLNGIEWKKDIIFISDDIEWCKSQPEFVNLPNVSFSSENPYVDLCLMTMCRTNIIANSSFSWWGGWLNDNKNKIIIAPSQWFGPALNHNTKDLIPNDWFLV